MTGCGSGLKVREIKGEVQFSYEPSVRFWVWLLEVAV